MSTNGLDILIIQGKQWKRRAELFLVQRVTTLPTLGVAPSSNLTQQLLTGQPQATSPGLDLSEFHFTFEIHSNDLETPNNMVCKIYNLDPATMKTIVEQYDQVSLSAGYYGSNFGIIFTGIIKWFSSGKDNITDNFLELTAGDDSYYGYNFGFVNTTLNPYTRAETWLAVYNACVAAMGLKPDEQSQNILVQGGIRLPRGRVMQAPAKVLMHDLSESLRARWSIQNGYLVLIQDTSVRIGAATVLAPDTGLIGIPTLTDQGVQARCLINPNLAIGSRVIISKELITETTVLSPYLGINGPTFAAKIAPGDNYRILQIDYTGDTRGQDWYCDIMCAAIDSVTGHVIGVPSGPA